jgi:hypothetical protein
MEHKLRDGQIIAVHQFNFLSRRSVRAHFSSDFYSVKSHWSQIVLIYIIFNIKGKSPLNLIIPACQTCNLFQKMSFLTFPDAFFALKQGLQKKLIRP